MCSGPLRNSKTNVALTEGTATTGNEVAITVGVPSVSN